MILSKIDQPLLTIALTMEANNKLECIVKAGDYIRLKKILKNRNIDIIEEYKFINAFLVKMDKKEILNLSQISQVKHISAVTKACALMHIARKIMGIDNINLSGKDVTIAFIDTGIIQHGDFVLGENRIITFKDFVGENTLPYDDNGHGTFVAGVASGSGALSGGYYCGIAPKSNIISLKALDRLGEASADKILKAMQWVYDNQKKYNIKVVCMSFGSDPLGFNDPIMSGAEALWREGVVVVAAAGNSGPQFQTIKSPGVSSQIITVGGFNDNRVDNEHFEENFFEIADFSSRGPAFSRSKPDLIAPAVDIVSCGIDKNYVTLSGTSVATPMVAGLCALILEENPQILPNEVKRRLLAKCKPITFNRNIEGYGYPSL